jgi:uncharacterized iron-regulated membrane protein
MSPLKKTFLFIHRWLGFVSGLVVVIVSVTGCIFAFQNELQDAIYLHRKVAIQSKPYLLPSQLKQIALKQYPNAATSTVGYYGPDRPAYVMMEVPKLGTRFIYLNPYTGRFLYDEDPEQNFFIIVENIHLYLLLPPEVGRQVVGWSVVAFVAIMITGIILWWPKRKSDRTRSFTIKWNGRWRRVNYDLHNVSGFYAFSIALMIAITGLSIAFTPVTDAMKLTANLGNRYEAEDNWPVSDSLHKAAAVTNPFDKAFIYAQTHTPQAKMFFVYGDTTKASATIGVWAYYKPMHYYKSDNYEFDQFTLKPIRILRHQTKSAGLKLNSMNYDLHVGQLFGLPGKIMAFLASLICASLPITGFIIWWGKRNKARSRSKTTTIAKTVAQRRLHKQLAIKP